jgi:hypothetical protein
MSLYDVTYTDTDPDKSMCTHGRKVIRLVTL